MLPIADFDYHLPPERIAQTPVEPRDHSRLLVLDRATGQLEHRHFYEIGRYLRPGDLLVANDSRVLPARLYGQKASGGKTELLLLKQRDAQRWEALIKGKVAIGTRLIITGHSGAHAEAIVEELLESGSRIVCFDQPINQRLPELGSMPTPPYITAPLSDPERYQTVYSAQAGSAAAPTAGLHWTPALIEQVKAQGVGWASVTLHVGLDTFRPVQTENALDHQIHSEWYELSAETAQAINTTRAAGGRIITVGTTSTRVVETVAQAQGVHLDAGEIQAASGWSNIYIYPPYQYRVVNSLITNFHLPKSTLLLLVSALASREQIMHAYAEAVERDYRFFSFGDAMLIL
ncbi:tRNA preQ1(34) S-adenosylmethionine ribosyltransferase-isomerase QueA [Herpetosiphon llansteffanensis]|uniref:tRNA preQ1(34) S-adenosylmethionine ribosyltransferase-isomerase QueA n=1 Tax=Herpetosiphon llansteffanensis TaxID=2094568 RepID=UPI000D7CEBDC|nr:tRNA preQ1(34) S-adenosylmethionine ribosyltransferase-isomerase QueA [Herpetosiphon llansteffanensis]